VLAANRTKGLPPIGIGAGSVIEGAILDKSCRIGRNVRIVNERGVETSDEHDACPIRDGIPVVVKDGTLLDGFKL
jgi:glucose-1-phosphate adenylyltransferase